MKYRQVEVDASEVFYVSMVSVAVRAVLTA